MAMEHSADLKESATPGVEVALKIGLFLFILIPPEGGDLVVRPVQQLDSCVDGAGVGLFFAREEGDTAKVLFGRIGDQRVVRIYDRIEIHNRITPPVCPGFHTIREEGEPFLGHDLLQLDGGVCAPGDGYIGYGGVLAIRSICA